MNSPPPNNFPPNNFPNNNRNNYANRNNNNNAVYTIENLLNAIARRDFDEVELHLGEFGKNDGFRGRTLLGEAIKIGEHELVKHLLTGANAANPNKETYDGPPLFLVNPTDTEMYYILLDNGAEPNREFEGHAVIEKTLYRNETKESLELLLQAGATIKLALFYHVITNSPPEIVTILLNNVNLMAYPNFINTVIERKDPALLEDIVKSSLSYVTHPPYPAVLSAVDTRNPVLLEILLDSDKFVLSAVEERRVVTEVINRSLLDMLSTLHTVYPLNRTEYLRLAIEKGSTPIIRKLVEWGATLSVSEMRTLVRSLIDANDVEMLTFLHSEMEVAFASYALEHAARKENWALFQLFVSWGVTLTPGDAQTVVKKLISSDNVPLLTYVHENVPTFEFGSDELVAAARNNSWKVFRQLISWGITLKPSVDKKPIVKHLIEVGDIPSLTAFHTLGIEVGSDELVLAMRNDKWDMVHTLVSWGATLNPTVNTKPFVQRLIEHGDLANLTYLHETLHAPIDPDMLQVAVEHRHRPVIDKLLTYGLHPTTRVLYKVAQNNDADLFKILADMDLTLLRKKMPFAGNKTLFELATDRTFSTRITNIILVGNPGGIRRWTGYTKGDMELFNMLFEHEPVAAGLRPPSENFAMCPVCLKYTERSTGCKYMMNHNCTLGGGLYHRALYERFKSPEGFIYFCTVCGRICLGHRHYDLQNWDHAHTLMPTLPGANPFNNECKSKEFGGNFEEKMARFRKLRATALAFQSLVGTADGIETFERLVEAVWNPFTPGENLAANLAEEAAGRWRIPASNFPLVTQTAQNTTALAAYRARWAEIDVLRPVADRGLTPLPAGNGMNSLMFEGELLRFRHRQPDGSIHEHTDSQLITQEGLADFINGIITQGIDHENFGKCFAFPDCNAFLYPEEILGLVEDDVYNNYRRIFNMKFHEEAEPNNAAPAAGAAAAGAGVMGGGARGIKNHVAKPNDLLQPMVDGACYLPSRAKKERKSRRRAAARRKTRKLRH